MEVHIVYIIDSNFVFYAAVSIYSLMVNSDNASNSYVIHFLVDSTIGKKERDFLKNLEDFFENLKFIYHVVDLEIFDDLDTAYTYLNKTTLYRLALPQLLLDIDKVIYIDADTIIHRNIASLANVNMDGFYIAGVWDMGMESMNYVLNELPDMNTYVNAGVLVMNLELMRTDNMQKKFFSKIPNRYFYNDQDILNICCYGKIKLLPEKYNYFSYRDSFNQPTVVTHFLSWCGLRPWQNFKAINADVWWKYAGFFKDSKLYKETYQKASEWYNSGSLKYILSRCREFEQIYIWGSTYEAMRLTRALMVNGITNISGIVDNKIENHGRRIVGKEVIAADEVVVTDSTLFICTATKSESIVAIKQQLLNMGIIDNQFLRYERHPNGFYTFLDPQFRQEEMDELFMWEYSKTTYVK